MTSKTKTLSAAVEIFDQEIEGVIRKIPLRNIEPATDQPRRNKTINIQSLASSLEQDGLLQPILVTGNKGRYTIIAGERRYRAAKLLDWSDIECRILDKSEQETYKIAVIENLQRENLDPVEESLAYKKLKKQFDYTDSELSKIVGKSRNYVSEILSIAEIPEPILHKANTSGLVSKNILIQLSQAVKKSLGDEFIQQFCSGEITTVKDAKNYLHTVTNPSAEESPLIQQNKIKNNPIKINQTESPSRASSKIPPISAVSYESILEKRKTSDQIEIKKDYTKNTLTIIIHASTFQLDNVSTNIVTKEIKTIIKEFHSNS